MTAISSALQIVHATNKGKLKSLVCKTQLESDLRTNMKMKIHYKLTTGSPELNKTKSKQND